MLRTESVRDEVSCPPLSSIVRMTFSANVIRSTNTSCHMRTRQEQGQVAGSRDDAHSRVLVRDCRRLPEELRLAARVIEPQRDPRARLSPDTERCPAPTTWLHARNHHGHNGLGAQPPLPVVADLSGQNSWPAVADRCSLGVAGSFSRYGTVWLYAAELDEHSLEPHILNQSFSVRKHDAGNTPPPRRKTRQSGGAPPNRPSTKLNDALRN